MFFFGKKKPPEKRVIRKPAATAGDQKRTAFRMPVEFPVLYALEGRSGRRGAVANDLSAGGLRLISDEDFLKGSMLSMQFRVPDDFLETMTIEKEGYEISPFGARAKSEKVKPPPFEEFKLRGKVLIAFFDLRRKKFAYGMSFVDVAESETEELQRFIHLWQLNQIRQRNAD